MSMHERDQNPVDAGTAAGADSSTDTVTLAIGRRGRLLSGTLLHDDEQRRLLLLTEDGPVQLSADLSVYRPGLTPAPGHVFIKDWGKHLGLTDALLYAGRIQLVKGAVVGALNSRAYEVRVL